MSLARIFQHAGYLAAVLLHFGTPSLQGQEDIPAARKSGPAPFVYKVRSANDRIEMTIDTSRVLTLEEEIPRVQVGNPQLISVLPLNANSIQIHAKKAGVTEINLLTKGNQQYSIDVVIHGDARALTEQLRAVYPRDTVTVSPSPNGVILGGYIESPEDVDPIIAIAKEFYPNVINTMRVAGGQQVLLNVTIAEVDRSGLQDIGFDFANVSTNSGSIVQSSVGGMLRSATATSATVVGNPQVQFGVINSSNSFFGVLALLEKKQLMKVKAQPQLTAISGRPAYFLVGGELPIVVPAGLGQVSIDFRKFGTEVDFVPIVLGNGRVHLEINPRVTEIDDTVSVTANNVNVPGFKAREINTATELNYGETMVVGGLIQQRTITNKQGIPYLMEVPYVGNVFSRNTNRINETELLIMCTPQPAEALEPCQEPVCVPGDSSRSASKWDFYGRGHIEVPNKDCMDGCCTPEATGQPVYQGETIPAGQPTTPSANRSLGTPRMAQVPKSPTPATAVPPQAEFNPYNPSSRQIRQAPPASPQSATKSSSPPLIGPLGYDVDK